MPHTSAVPRLRVGLIGAGRAGTVVARALERVGHHCLAVNAVSEASRERAARMLPSAEPCDPETLCRAVDLVIVAVPDDVIEPTVDGLVRMGAITNHHIVVHLSGRHGTAVLHSAARVGAATLAVHPAMTMQGRVEDVQRLDGCAFAVTAEGDALAIGMALVYEIGGHPTPIGEADRTLYHAALAHASNHLVTVLAQSMEMLTRVGIDDPGRYLSALVDATVYRTLREGDAALTGPIARGDVATVRAHVEAIASSALPASTLAAYRAVAQATADRHGRDLGPL